MKDKENALIDLEALKDNLSNQIAHLSQELKRYTSKGKETAVQAIEERPLQSVGIALACGLVIGFLLGKK